MDKIERLRAHDVENGWMPNPEAHLANPRDSWHFKWVVSQLAGHPGSSVLDVGCYDGWLDFLLIGAGHKVHGVELIPELCASAHAYATKHRLDYKIHQGFFDEVQIKDHYDVVICLETLEHVSLDLVPVYVAKMEAIAKRKILVSLPDQRHEENPQHLWSPSMTLIDSMWSKRKNFKMEYHDYPGTDIPGNFWISWGHA
jgi:cyclopropane fatty-acyl-phospholipid synthase-like methyltransferase